MARNGGHLRLLQERKFCTQPRHVESIHRSGLQSDVLEKGRKEERLVLQQESHAGSQRIRRTSREWYPTRTIDDLHRIILDWSPRSMEDSLLEPLLANVKNTTTWNSEFKYIKTFEPLVLEEIRSSILKATQEEHHLSRTTRHCNGPKWACRAPLQVEPSKIHLQVFGTPTYENTGGFDTLPLKFDGHLRDSAPHRMSQLELNAQNDYSAANLRPTDLVLLRMPERGYYTESLSSSDQHVVSIFGYVIQVKHQFNKTFLSVRTRLSGKYVIPDPSCPITISKLLNMQSYNQHFQAIWSIYKLPSNITTFLLQPDSCMKYKPTNAMKRFRKSVEHFGIMGNLNRSQFRAVHAVIRAKNPSRTTYHSSITLLQGPPGTGKSRTIIAILTQLLDEGRIGFRDMVRSSKMRNEKSVEPCRILVCAPSNAAVDALMRSVLSNGIELSNGAYATPQCVRIGTGSTDPVILSTTPNARLKKQHRDEADIHLSKLRTSRSSILQKVRNLSIQIGAVDRERQVVRESRTVSDHATSENLECKEKSLTQELCALHESKKKILTEIAGFDKRIEELNRERERKRVSRLDSIVSSASLVFATLNSSGADILKTRGSRFSAIVIDEAAQSVEPETLIPVVNFPCSDIILVGDQKQLPATVISNHPVMKTLYRRSLFERLVEHGNGPIYLLARQYRMHPVISWLPCRLFYSGRLKNAPSATGLEFQRPYHTDPLKRFGPVSFIDTSQLEGAKEERSVSGSMYNRPEALVVAAEIASLLRLYPTYVKSSDICVLTPYRAQIQEIEIACSRIHALHGVDIQVSTIDSIQGQEKDIVILSTVRGSTGSLGFVSDAQRMNVAITRSKNALIVIGNSNGLSLADSNWAALVERCESLGSLLQIIGTVERHFPEAFSANARCAKGPFRYPSLLQEEEASTSEEEKGEGEEEEEEEESLQSGVISVDVHAQSMMNSNLSSNATRVLQRIKATLENSKTNDLASKRESWRAAVAVEHSKIRRNQMQSAGVPVSREVRQNSPLSLESSQNARLKRRLEETGFSKPARSSKVLKVMSHTFDGGRQRARKRSVSADQGKLNALRNSRRRIVAPKTSAKCSPQKFSLGEAIRDVRKTVSHCLRI